MPSRLICKCRLNRQTVSPPQLAKIFQPIMNTSRIESRFILAMDRFLQARTREEKVQAAHWVNAWRKHAKITPVCRPKEQAQRFD
jgi:hypothetical protein